MVPTTIWQSIAEIPWWIFVLLTYCIWLTFQATKPRDLNIKALYLFPALFTGLSVMCMAASVNMIDMWLFLTWGVMVILGTGLSYLHFLYLRVKAYHDKQSLYFPGTFLPLISLIIGLSTKFYFHYSISFDPMDLAKPQNLVLLLISYGFFTGIFLGRLGYAIRCINEGPYIARISLENAG